MSQPFNQPIFSVVILDEVPRVHRLFSALKLAIDRRRELGRAGRVAETARAGGGADRAAVQPIGAREGVSAAPANHTRLFHAPRDVRFQELQRQATGDDFRLAFYHYRDKDDAEVDIVVERGAHALVGGEVKAAATVTKDDFRGLRKLRRAAAERFVAGVVLYDGEICASFGDGFFAVPLRLLWEPVRVSPRT